MLILAQEVLFILSSEKKSAQIIFSLRNLADVKCSKKHFLLEAVQIWNRRWIFVQHLRTGSRLCPLPWLRVHASFDLFFFHHIPLYLQIKRNISFTVCLSSAQLQSSQPHTVLLYITLMSYLKKLSFYCLYSSPGMWKHQISTATGRGQRSVECSS